ncbi:MAG: MGDG synthase family glycosyltransferase [Bacilli bacterium]
MNVLVLTGKFGMGHYSVAQSIKEHIHKEYPYATIYVIDILDYLVPQASKMVYSSYNLMVQKASVVYNFLYKTSTKFDDDRFIPKWTLEKMKQLIQLTKPDVAISTLPLSSAMVSKYKQITGSRLPLVTCMTDISTNTEWIKNKTDMYLVATEEVKTQLVETGITEGCIQICGIPVKEKFKTALILPVKERKQLLVMGGGLGLIPVTNHFYDTLNEQRDVCVTVITGKNKKEYDRLKAKYPNIEVLGFTDKVDEYMQNADLIVSKAGGITLFEIIHKEVPLVVFSPFLEQERYNAEFIEKRGIGEVLWDKKDDAACRALTILNDEEKLATMKVRMKGIKSEIDINIIRNIVSTLNIIGVA